MKKHLIRLAISITFAFSFLTLKAQDPNGINLPQIIPPGPISQEFQRFLGYSINGSTGTSDISIPLYKLNASGISIPFSLKYNSSGIKVDQTPGIAGYGWSLFPGFKITRTIMGKPDEYYHNDNIVQAYATTASYLVDIATPASNQDNLNTINDGQFDLFSIHLPNKDGGFIIKISSSSIQAVSIPNDPLIITPLINSTTHNLYGFDVKDDQGTEYLFGQADDSNNGQGAYTEGNYRNITGWNLRQMILPGVNNIINFTYVDAGEGNNTVLGGYTVWDDVSNGNDDDGSSRAAVMPGSADFYIQESGTSYIGAVSSKTLKTVTFNNGSILLNYLAEGSLPLKLSTFQIFNSNQQILRTISFFRRSPNYSLESNLLDRIEIADMNSSKRQTYQFSYNSRRFNSIYDQDWWGYYNNKGNSGANIAPLYAMNLVAQGGSPQQIGNADRSVDTAAAKANILTKISYPTGGSTTLFYESNEYGSAINPSFGPGLRINRTDTFDPVANQTITKTYNYGYNESGIGNINYIPRVDDYIDEQYLYASGLGDAQSRRRTLSSYSKYRYFNFLIPIWYQYVNEYADGGKTTFQYNYNIGANDITGVMPGNTGDLDENGITTPLVNDHTLEVPSVLRNLVLLGPDLIDKQIFKYSGGSYTLLQEISYGYAIFNANDITGVFVIPRAFFMGKPYVANYYWSSAYNSIPISFHNINPFFAANYTIKTGRNNLFMSTITDYRNGTSIATQINKTFDLVYPFNTVTDVTTNSDNSTTTNNYYYPTSSSIPNLTTAQQSMVGTLNSNNRLTALIEKTTTKNTAPVSGELYAYRDWGNNILAPEVVYTRKGTNAYEPRLQYLNYDNKGNIQSVAKGGGLPVSYLWGYNKQYPIAQATSAAVNEIYHDNFEEGTDYPLNAVIQDGTRAHTGNYSGLIVNPSGSEVYYHSNTWLQIFLTGTKKFHYSGWFYSDGPTYQLFLFMKRAGETGYFSYVSNVDGSQTGGWVYLEGDYDVPADVTQLNLRVDNNGGGNVWFDDLRLYPSAGQMTTYTYSPLVGMTSMTDPKGQTTYYEYDPFQRLMNVKDKDGNIIKHTDYHYANQ